MHETNYSFMVDGNFDPADAVAQVLELLRNRKYVVNNVEKFSGETDENKNFNVTTTGTTEAYDYVKPSTERVAQGTQSATTNQDVSVSEQPDEPDFSDAADFLSLIESVADMHKILAKTTRAVYGGDGVKFSPEQTQALYKMIMAPYGQGSHELHDYLQAVHKGFSNRDFDLDTGY